MLGRMLIRELLHRKLNFGLGCLAVAVAVGSLVGASILLGVHDAHTQKILKRLETETGQKMAALEDEIRKAMLKLSFSLVILPKGQNLRDWHTEDYASEYMPEDYVTRLANSGIITVRHFLPSLQQKIKWPETQRTIILVGTRGEVPSPHLNPVKPLIQPVPEGAIVLGHELHESLGIKVGDTITLMGRQFVAHKCHEARGSKDDITAWISLREAQELFDKQGLINAILALECLCAGTNPLPIIREEIARILPGTQVIEIGTKALARMEARWRVGQESKAAAERERLGRARLRAERERFAAILVPLLMAACALWLAILGFADARNRRREIGILGAIGFRSRQVFSLFLCKPLAMGVVGGILGCFAGILLGRQLAAALGEQIERALGAEGTIVGLCLSAIGIAAILSALAGWIPAMLAAYRDPAEALREG